MCQLPIYYLSVSNSLSFALLGDTGARPCGHCSFASWLDVNRGAGMPLWPAEQEEGISLPFPALVPARLEEEPR